MKKETPIKRSKRKKDHLHMSTWDGIRFQQVNMPEYLADDFVREFVLTVVPGTEELQTWIAKKTIK